MRRRVPLLSLVSLTAFLVGHGCGQNTMLTVDSGATSAGTQDTGNGSFTPSTPFRIQAVGDSALEWNGERSTANQLQTVLSERGYAGSVQNNAIGGATISCGEEGVGTPDNCIPPQYEPGSWTHVLVSGGGNDILDSDCRASADLFMGPDLRSGIMYDFLRRLLEDGENVLLYGYFLPRDPESFEATCTEIPRLLARYRDFAATQERVRYIDAGVVLDRSTPSYYDDDIHPSPAGSRVIAEYLADQMGYAPQN